MHSLDGAPICAMKGNCSEKEVNLQILSDEASRLLVVEAAHYLQSSLNAQGLGSNSGSISSNILNQ